mmetsp:Transcript_85417/g.236693  ORF Transcript_85417/g.236693 Transcript_85417/m.236693 type:complete len:312 (-) Transcript_85417:61-996(-)
MRRPGALSSPSSLYSSGSCASSRTPLRSPAVPSARRPSTLWPPLFWGEAARGGSRFQGARRKGKPRLPVATGRAGGSWPSASFWALRASLLGWDVRALLSSLKVACIVPSPATSASEGITPTPSEMGTSPWCGAGGGRWPAGRVRLCALLSRLLERRRNDGKEKLSFSLERPTRPPSRDAARSASSGSGTSSRVPSRLLLRGSSCAVGVAAAPGGFGRCLPLEAQGRKLRGGPEAPATSGVVLEEAACTSCATSPSLESPWCVRSGEDSACSSWRGIIVGGVRGRRLGLLGPSSSGRLRRPMRLKRLKLRL